MTETPEEIVPVRDALRELFDRFPDDASIFKDFRQVLMMLAIAKELGREIDRVLPDFKDGPLKGMAEHMADELYRIADEQIEALDLSGIYKDFERRFLR